MAKKLSKNESLNFKNEMLAKFDDYLTGLIEGEQKAKAEKISFWILDWINYLDREENFSPNKMLKYKRGSIVKVHLGFNVGSEEGGLHYAIVIDADNDLSNPVFTVIPLTSVKPHTDLDKLGKNQIFIGNEIYEKLTNKLKKLLSKLSSIQLPEATEEELAQFQNELAYAKRIKAEIDKMKTGSIALIGQVTTVSKLRIFDPRNRYGVLKGLRVSDDILNKIDEHLQKNFFKK
jgi:pemK-like protein